MSRPNISEILDIAKRVAPLAERVSRLARSPSAKVVAAYLDHVRKIERLRVGQARARRSGFNNRADRLGVRIDEAARAAEDLKPLVLAVIEAEKSQAAPAPVAAAAPSAAGEAAPAPSAIDAVVADEEID